MTPTICKSLNSQDTIFFNDSKSGESKSSILDHADSKLRSGGLEDSPCMLDSGLCINASAGEVSPKFQPTVCNRRPLSQDAETYQLDKFSKNLMLVFNMYNIPGREPRYGTGNDVEALKRCFEPLGFDVMVYSDFTKDGIYTTFEKLISDDLSDVGCLAVVFLSHGNGDGIILTRDHPINESAIIEFLSESNAPSLITKPKILIFQVSRYGGTTETTSYNFQEVDFLSLHSTCPGMLSYRDCNDGSWFIQSLCKLINASNPDDDILSIIHLVIKDITTNYERRIRNQHCVLRAADRQVPIVTTTLTRKLCFNTKRDFNSSKTQMDGSKDTKERRALSQRPMLDALLNKKFDMEELKLKYFEYVKDRLGYYVDTSDPDHPNAKQARQLLEIAKVMNCSHSHSKTRDEICHQMVKFLKGQNFAGKEFMFLYKYS